MKLPKNAEIERLWQKHRNPSDYYDGRIRAHTITIRRVATTLAKRLKEKGHDIDPVLIEKAAQLHDVTKKDEDHPTTAAKMLRGKGYPEIARVVGSHDSRTLLSRDWRKMPLDEIVLMYADARSSSGWVESLEERSRILQERYPKGKEDIAKSFARLGEFERWLEEKGIDHHVELSQEETAEVERQRARGSKP